MLVICPAFVSDCLETIEEIGMRGRDSFVQAGGKRTAADSLHGRAPALDFGAGELRDPPLAGKVTAQAAVS